MLPELKFLGSLDFFLTFAAIEIKAQRIFSFECNITER